MSVDPRGHAVVTDGRRVSAHRRGARSRAFEIISNYIVELAGLALKELGIAPIDGARDLDALADEGVITKRLAEQLADSTEQVTA
jgi:uncharacterized protein YutE (UPF0331/DUF86 family)